jgi:ubiquitin carboxyl-terminal hydrolase 12/46
MYNNFLAERQTQATKSTKSASSTSAGSSNSAAAGAGAAADFTTDSNRAQEPTWVHEIFQGILTSETRCLNCEMVSHNSIPS